MASLLSGPVGSQSLSAARCSVSNRSLGTRERVRASAAPGGTPSPRVVQRQARAQLASGEAHQQQHQQQQQQQQQQQDVQQLERSYLLQPRPQLQPHGRRGTATSPLLLLEAVRAAELRLEEDLATVAATITFVVAMIALDRGVQDLLDNVLGDSPTGSVACVLFGLGLVAGVRVAGGKVGDHFSL